MPSKKLKIKCKSDCIVPRTIKNLNDGNSMMMLKIISVWKNLVRGNTWIFYLILKDTQDTGELVHIEYGEVFIWKIVLGTYIIQLHQMLLLFILSCQFYSSLYSKFFFFHRPENSSHIFIQSSKMNGKSCTASTPFFFKFM